VPKYEPIDDKKYYKVIVNDYTADGGDGFTMFAKYAKNVITGPRDVDALSDYIQKYTPFVMPPLMGRITIRNG
jgi:2',3'-cyclic-nucleotide 2'-phosphodiesterase (5'-nucleotidase family)